MSETATIADQQASLEAVIKDEVFRMYQEVADNPDADFHFFHGRAGAEMFGLFEYAGFKRVRSTVVPGFRFKRDATRDAAEAYGVKAVLFTAQKP